MDVSRLWRKLQSRRMEFLKIHLGRPYFAGVKTGSMVNFPDPVQFAVAPETVQLPVICPPLTMPSRLRVFTSVPVDRTT